MSTYLFELITKLRKANIYFELSSHREDYIMITAFVPGQRWEIELADDGVVEIEIFRSDGNIYDQTIMEKMFNDFTN